MGTSNDKDRGMDVPAAFDHRNYKRLKEYPSARLLKVANRKAIAKPLKQPYVGKRLFFSAEDAIRAALAESFICGGPELIRIIFAGLSQ